MIIWSVTGVCPKTRLRLRLEHLSQV
jgi:hypothetical protein